MCAAMKFLQSPKVVIPRTHDTSNVSELNEGVVRSPASQVIMSRKSRSL